MGEYGKRKPMYQGNMQQIYELSDILPNLKTVLVFGNPDISVDPIFCNELSKYFQTRGVTELYFSTSGIGGKKVMEQLLDGIDPTISKVSFSVDSIDDKKLSFLKGVNISLETILEGIDYCKSLGYEVSILTTLWSLNMNEDWTAFTEFFKFHGVFEFKANFGSLESAESGVAHVPVNRVVEIREQFSKFGRLARIFVDDEEFENYLVNYRSKCSQITEFIDVFLEGDGIKAAIPCPVIWAANPDYIVDICKLKLPVHKKVEHCPNSKKAIGFDVEHLHPVCRYYRAKNK